LNRRLEIEQANNGYIVTETSSTDGWTEVFLTLDAAFERLLGVFEWRSPRGAGESAGEVVIHRGEKAKSGP
jgi:hypothetical protein